MKTIKIYGKTYKVHPSCRKEPNLYWHDNELTDEPLDREPDGYIKMDDGNIVGVYGKKNLIIPIVAVCCVALIGVGGYSIVSQMTRPKALTGTLVKVAQPGNNEINFNTFLQCDGEKADIRFTNGQESIRVSITGDGIESKPTVLEPGATLATIPMRYSTKESAVEATLTVEQGGATYNYPVVIEIPNNMSAAGGSSERLITEDEHVLSEEMLIQ